MEQMRKIWKKQYKIVLKKEVVVKDDSMKG